MRRTKIVATLGPASTSPEVFRRLVEAGLDVARINLSHGSADQHRHLVRMVRSMEQEIGRPIGILLDTAGPEVRLRTQSQEGIALHPQGVLALGLDQGADLTVSIPQVLECLRAGDVLVIGDGNLVLEVEKPGDPAWVRVIQGGWLPDNKKVTCPGQVWPLPVLTETDLEALRMGIEEGVDWIAASFIRTADDVVEVKRQVEAWEAAVPVMAKIETRAAFENLDAIVRLADGLMVARGDLGVEYPPEDVPWLQKAIIDAANHAGKPVITATQMLESMVHESRPTRAEITDVAHAVLEGSDAVMLSEETAVGEFPAEAVRVMARAAEVSEAHPWEERGRRRYVSGTVTDAVCHAALTAAEDLDARIIITATESGHTAQSMAAHRPRVPILAVTPYESVARRLSLVWGLESRLMQAQHSLEGMMEEAVAIARKSGRASAGDRVIITAGAPVGEAGSTNVLRVVTIGEILLRGQGMGPEGEVQGPVKVVRDPVQDGSFPEGTVLVAKSTDASWVPLMERARAIVTEAGGLTSHAAIIGISLGIPTVVGVPEATRTLTDGQIVTVDAAGGLILSANRNG